VEKLVYLVFQEAELDGAELRRALIDKAVPALRAGGAQYVTVHVQDEAVAAGQALRKSDPPIRAMVSFWLENHDDRAACEAALASHARKLAGYLVAESRPMIHERVQGERSPGMCQVTCIAKLPELSWDEFYRIWTTDHKQVAIDTQSTTGYVRNVFVRPLTAGAPDQWHAIVEETFPIGALDDPKVFYDADSDAKLKANLETMMQSCNRFLDMGPLEFTHMSEYWLG
jgi:hypothetical protein